ncbi:MAG: DUF4968 domain-containing protein, partial [Clostridiales bacterium]|nr:DUF4968 domain-containing protein [Clostridiales bacterium]
MFGKLLEYQQVNQKVIIQFEKREGSIEFIQDNMIRIFSAFEKKEQISYAVLPGVMEKGQSLEVMRQGQKLILKNTELWIEVSDEFKVDIYDKNQVPICMDYRGTRTLPVIPEDVKQAALEGHSVTGKGELHKIQVIKEMAGSEVFYGLGDKTGFLNKRGYEYVMWNSDIPDPHVDSFSALYKSIPFFITLAGKHVYGMFFDNPHRSFFDMGKESDQYYFFGADQGNLDYYFMYGKTVSKVIGSYTRLTGTHPMPALWTLGYHQSRWSYESEEVVRKIAANLQNHKIPCDCIHLDIDYMDGCRVFTHNSKNFPHFAKMIEDLKEEGLKIVTIIDPGVKKEDGYAVYEEGVKEDFYVKDLQGENYTNWVWPGTVVFPDFSNSKVRTWWGEKQKYLQELGVSGVWNDMNEPASFHGELPGDIQFFDEGNLSDHRRIHNVYGHLMSKATYEGWKENSKKRPFV